MKRYSKSKPLWLQPIGTSIKKATAFGIMQWCRANGLTETRINTIQDGEIVNHPLNETIIKDD